jgi:hypothetical protein
VELFSYSESVESLDFSFSSPQVVYVSVDCGSGRGEKPCGRKVLCQRVIDPFNKLIKLFTGFKATSFVEITKFMPVAGPEEAKNFRSK